MTCFVDRADAARRLACRLTDEQAGRQSGRPDRDCVVLGLPRGGVVVAAAVADALDAPLDVVVVRRLGVPFHLELAMGAIAEGGVRVVDEALALRSGVTSASWRAVEQREREVLAARVRAYRAVRPPADLRGRVALVVDDGVATGVSARAACRAVRRRGAARVVLAVPVAPAATDAGTLEADDLVVLDAPPGLTAVGSRYAHFGPTTDEEVLDLLERHGRHPGGRSAEVSGEAP